MSDNKLTVKVYKFSEKLKTDDGSINLPESFVDYQDYKYLAYVQKETKGDADQARANSDELMKRLKIAEYNENKYKSECECWRKAQVKTQDKSTLKAFLVLAEEFKQDS